MAAKAEFLLDGVGIVLLPPPIRRLPVSFLWLVHIDLAEIMKQGDDGCGFVRHRDLWKGTPQTVELIEDVQGMLQKTTRMVSVVPGAGGSLIEVALFQPRHQGRKPLSMDLLLANGKKPFFVCHKASFCSVAGR